MRDAADLIAKAAAALGVAAYLVGLLVVNTYLYSLGVSLADPAVFKARFIYTGGVTLGLLAVSFGLPVYGLSRAGALRRRSARPGNEDASVTAPSGHPLSEEPAIHPADTSARTSRAHTIGILIVTFVIPFLVVVALLRQASDPPGALDLLGEALSLNLLALVLGAAIFFAVYTAAGRGEAKLPRWSGVLGITFLSGALLLVYIALVGRYVYPALPEQFGGGKPRAVQLVLGNDSSAQAKALGLTSGNSPLAAEALILFDGRDFVVLQRLDGRVIEVDKSLLAGIMHAARET